MRDEGPALLPDHGHLLGNGMTRQLHRQIDVEPAHLLAEQRTLHPAPGRLIILLAHQLHDGAVLVQRVVGEQAVDLPARQALVLIGLAPHVPLPLLGTGGEQLHRVGVDLALAVEIEDRRDHAPQCENALDILERQIEACCNLFPLHAFVEHRGERLVLIGRMQRQPHDVGGK